MLTSAEIFMKSYLWKYIDIAINNKEREYIVENSFYDPDTYSLFRRFEKLFGSEEDIKYYVLILSSLNQQTFRRLIVYYMINVSRYDKVEDVRPYDITDIDKFIGNSSQRFLILLLSIHFYF